MTSRLRTLGMPEIRVLWLVVLTSALATSLAVPVVRDGDPSPGSRALPFAVLAVCYLAFEPVRLHLQVRRYLQHAQTVTFNELPLALGLLFAAPLELLVVGVAAPVLLNGVHRMDPLKQVFNAGNRFLELAVALAVYTALVPADPFSWAGWLVLCLSVALSGTITALCVTAAISLSTGRVPREDLGPFLASAAPVSAVVGTIGFTSGLVWQGGESGAVALLVVLVLILVGLRAFSLLTERHMDVVDLHGWSQRLTAAGDVDRTLGQVLDAATDLLKAERSCVWLVDEAAGSVRVERTSDGAAIVRTSVRTGDVPTTLGVDSEGRAVHARTDLGPGRWAVLTVTGRPRSLRAFSRDDARLLEMVADKTGMALRNGHLIDRLRHEALHDALTGLPNRVALVQELTERAQCPGGSQVVWLGLRDQQMVNEALGYDSGDELLRQVAHRLSTAVPPEALVARVNGDEFAVLSPHSADDGWSTTVSAALSHCFDAPFALFGVQVAVRASIGHSGLARPGVDTALHLLRHADTAMRAARRGGDDVEQYTPALETATADRLALVVELQEGIERGELVLYVQPQVRLHDGTVSGAEALVRWQHPRLGLLPPGAFLPLAEQTRLDEPLTRWVLDASLQAAAAWRAAGLDLTIAVNVPARSVSDPRLCESVAAALRKHSLPGEALVLEITESGLLGNPTAAAEVLADLAALGITVSVDDFGTGFSSLSHLKRLPVDEIKIDRSFVSSMLDDVDDAAIVRSVIDLARNLGLSCVAEGIEDQATYDALRALGCDIAQGYFSARPMPVADVPAWLARRALTTPVIPAPRPKPALRSVMTG